VFDLLEDVMADLEGLPAALAAAGGELAARSADAEPQLEVVGDLLRPIVAPGADALEEAQAAIEGIPGKLAGGG
jgi:hypothetical protein